MLTEIQQVEPKQQTDQQQTTKAILERLTENRDYCVLCPLKAVPRYKTRGALKFHLRIKHSQDLISSAAQKMPKSTSSPPPLIESNFNPPSINAADKNNEQLAINSDIEDESWTLSLDPDEDDQEESSIPPKLFQRGLMTEMIRESLPKLDMPGM